MDKARKKEIIIGSCVIFFSLFLLLSLIGFNKNDYSIIIKESFFSSQIQNFAGGAGAYLSHWGYYLFGYPVYLLTFTLIFLGIGFCASSLKEIKWIMSVKFLVLTLIISIVLNVFDIFFQIKDRIGGILTYPVSFYLLRFFGKAGTFLVLFSILFLSLIFFFHINLFSPFKNFSKIDFGRLKNWLNQVKTRKKKEKKTSSKADENELKVVNIEKKKKTSLNNSQLFDDNSFQEKPKVPPSEDPLPAAPAENEMDIDNEIEDNAPIFTPKSENNTQDTMGIKIVSGDEISEGIYAKIDMLDSDDDTLASTPSNVAPTRKIAAEKKTPSPRINRDNDQEAIDIDYSLPEVNLIDDPPKDNKPISKFEIQQTSAKLEAKLREFKIQSKIVAASPGPIVTLYELKLAPGVSVNKVTRLVDDISLALSGRNVRIIAPIPGKETIGIEVPNTNPEIVYFKSILTSEDFQKSKRPLQIALGKNIGGDPFSSALAKMPHLLIAGATGSGKSVCLNTVLSSFLYTLTPSELRLILIDPKMIEFSIYNDIPHLLTPVVTKPKEAVAALKWSVTEMENRYRMLAKMGARNITEFNQKVDRYKAEDPDADMERLTYLVIIIDELADLMITASGEIEESIARLAQMARAVGIHLILATQRPSVNVITGVIKANFPTRIAFQVAQKNDSRTILDMNGAENLLGKGDMLFLPPGKAMPYRIHGAFITTEETEKIVDFWRQYPTNYESIFEEMDDTSPLGVSGERDSLFGEAAKIVITHHQGSTSLLQRRLRIGYARAARVMDQLEEAGIVGPNDGSKAREVLVDETYLSHVDD